MSQRGEHRRWKSASRVLAAAVTSVTLDGVVACGAPVSSTATSVPACPPPTCATTEPTVPGDPAGVVARYYQAAAAGDAPTARSLLSPTALAFAERSVAADWTNIVSLTKFQTETVRPDPNEDQVNEPGFTDTTQVTVDFDVVYRDASRSGSSNGPTIRFVIVGRGRDGSWRILSIGSGP